MYEYRIGGKHNIRVNAANARCERTLRTHAANAASVTITI